MRVSDVLADKGDDVYSTVPEVSVLDAVHKLVQNNIGALAVVDADGKLVGIVSERDVLRLVARGPLGLGAVRISDCMVRKVYIARPSDSIDEALLVMNTQHVRHLPVVDQGQLIGLVSQGDLVKAKLEVAEFVTRHLTDFVMGKYPA